VILISVDTLRSDHLPAYGYSAVQTPNLDALRNDSILYERAYSHTPLTFPSHTSMLTGLLPADSGIRDNTGYKLAKNVPTLAEALKKNGYATGAAISAFVLRKQTGIDRGFDFYDDDTEAIGPSRVIGRIQRRGPDTVKVAREWIARQNENPFFFFLHLYDPHTPYDAPEPFAGKYPLAYDAEIAYVDQSVGEFLQSLKDSGVYDRALIIFLSDHGEGLNEHQEEEHGLFLYREAIQVPLMVKLPKQAMAGKSVAAPVQLADVLPTIVAQTKTRFDGAKLAGRSLLDFLDAGVAKETRSIYSETYYPRFHFGWSDLHSLIRGNDHFIRAPKPELYDLAADPGEKVNTLTENRRVYSALRTAIEPFVKEAAAPAAVDPEEAAKLAALGYLGSSMTADSGGALADPKDKIDTFRQMKVAFTLQRDRKYVEALAAVDAILAENDRMTDMWDLKAKLLQTLGRFPEAIEAAKQAFRLSPNAAHLAISIADLYLELNDTAQAQAHAELALKGEGGRAHEVLARVWMMRGDLAKAEKEAQASLADKADRATTLLTLARIEKQRGDYAKALTYLDQAMTAVKESRTVSKLHFMRGDVLARLGRDAEAEKEFREEIQWFPEDPQAYKNLMLLLVVQGRTQEATQLIFDLIKASPSPPAYLAVAETLRVVGDERGARFWARKGLSQFPRSEMLRTF
jgi:arylsulfatase A-like enzyme/Tfp pilus assembly protein PilF